MISKFGNGVVIKRNYPTDGYPTTTTTTTTATTTPRPPTTTTESIKISQIVPHRTTRHHHESAQILSITVMCTLPHPAGTSNDSDKCDFKQRF